MGASFGDCANCLVQGAPIPSATAPGRSGSATMSYSAPPSRCH